MGVVGLLCSGPLVMLVLMWMFVSVFCSFVGVAAVFWAGWSESEVLRRAHPGGGGVLRAERFSPVATVVRIESLISLTSSTASDIRRTALSIAGCVPIFF